ncbi:hypothetical protein [Lactococcus formosensis]|jgi:DNA helicase HerA-like ATPase|uniref:TraG P-loop domain-containing protein n=1 Tax=Lactococcus formosensis TaxID=1281486 RepID=A0A9Q8Y372_9LACT|nr:hypothetical protein [Lactococcus formosensis]USI69026.1 hypothetical protein LMK04_04625 [Lactococcus petauri]USJ21213.1 hypothetical protein LMK00_04200 [Lactococcus formosensis]
MRTKKKITQHTKEDKKLITERKRVQIEKEVISRRGGDLDFINAIAPQSLDPMPDDYIKTATGYSTCIHIVDLPDFVHYFWIRDLCAFPNSIFTLTMANGDKSTVIKQANRAYQEYSSRIGKVNSPEKEIEAREQADKMWAQIQTYRKNTTSVKKIVLRIFLYTNTLEELMNERDKALKELLDKGYEACVYAMYQKEEYESLSLPFNVQTSLAKPLEPKTSDVGYGAPFDKVDLLDSFGAYIGYTASGLVLFDLHHVDNKRKAATGVIFGQMGSGKSNLTKQIIEAELAKENKVRLYVISDEYDNIIEQYGGVMINIFGEENRINPFQIFPTVTDEAGNVLEHGSFTAHISKIATMFRMLGPTIDSLDQNVLSSLLLMFYQAYGILKFKNSEFTAIEPITTLQNDAYPIASDFLNYLEENVESIKKALPLQKNLMASLEKISSVLQIMTGLHSSIFNGPTVLDYDENALLVCYDMRQRDIASKEVRDCQFYSSLMTIWKEAINSGLREKKLYTNKEKDLEDIIRMTVIMDEVQNYLNADMGYAVTIIANFAKEMRKLFAGLLLITPSAQQFFPTTTDSEAATQMKQIFHLCTYKFFFKANEGDIKLYSEIFNSAMNPSRLKSLTQFGTGDAYLIIGDNKTYRFRVQYDPEKEMLYAGGI